MIPALQGAAYFENDIGSVQPDRAQYGTPISWMVTELKPYGASLTLQWEFHGNKRMLVLPVTLKMIADMRDAFYNSLDQLVWPEEDNK